MKWSYFSHYWPIVGGIQWLSADYLHKMQVLWHFDVSFDVILNKMLDKQSSRRWFQMPWRSCYDTVIVQVSLQWSHKEHDGLSNHRPHDCLLSRLFMRRSKKTSKLRVTDLCEGNSPVTGEFPAQRASYAESVSIWWRHHAYTYDSVKKWWTMQIYISYFIRTIQHAKGQRHMGTLAPEAGISGKDK